MTNVSKNELNNLREVQTGGTSPVIPLLVLAGTGLVIASILAVYNSTMLVNNGRTVEVVQTTTTSGYQQQQPQQQQPQQQTTTTVVSQNPGYGQGQGQGYGPGYGGPGYGPGYGQGSDIMPFAAGIVVGDILSEGGGQGGGAVSLPSDGKNNGWVKYDNVFYHYNILKGSKGGVYVQIRKFENAN
jgi:hypothetical protein